jgi:hypothetical protein
MITKFVLIVWIGYGQTFVYDPQRIYLILSRAAGRIDSQARELKKLSDTVSDMGWRLNPDRMGGQFTEEEKNRSGWL